MANLKFSIDDDLKRDAEKIIRELGLTPKTAIAVFYKQIVEQGKIPFSIELSERSKLALSIQRLSEDLPVERLHNDEKINDWLNEEQEK